MSEDPKPYKAKPKDAEMTIKFESSELRGKIPGELYERVLETSAAMGLSKTQTLLNALTRFVTENSQTRQNFLEEKSEEWGIPKHKVRAKILENYQQEGKKRTAKLDQ